MNVFTQPPPINLLTSPCGLISHICGVALWIVPSFQPLTYKMSTPRRGWITTKSGCVCLGTTGTSYQIM